jgi:hypothetical protein
MEYNSRVVLAEIIEEVLVELELGDAVNPKIV